MEATKLTTSKIYEQIAQLLRQEIVAGRYVPGAKLPSTRELAEHFQVGRSTVREALSALKAMGLVESRQGEGSYVCSMQSEQLEMPNLRTMLLDRTTILELFEARKALETSNAYLAAGKRTEEDLHQFAVIITQMQQNPADGELGEETDIAFHLTLARATHNSIMVRLWETISSQMELAIRETRRMNLYANHSVAVQLLQEHIDIYEAIRAQNPSRAEERMNQHLFHVERVLLQFLRE